MAHLVRRRPARLVRRANGSGRLGDPRQAHARVAARRARRPLRSTPDRRRAAGRPSAPASPLRYAESVPAHSHIFRDSSATSTVAVIAPPIRLLHDRSTRKEMRNDCRHRRSSPLRPVSRARAARPRPDRRVDELHPRRSMGRPPRRARRRRQAHHRQHLTSQRPGRMRNPAAGPENRTTTKNGTTP